MGPKKIDYFEIADLLDNKYPEAWCYICIGGRGIGKTYSTLKYMLDYNKRFVFVKRTMDDVNLICAGNGKIGSKPKLDENGVVISADFSPFVPLNRDMHRNVQAWNIRSGIGGFWNATEELEPFGPCLGYTCALSGVTKYKGFDMSEADFMIFDEFIPQPWERVSKKEGEQILDLHKTISRDREQRGRGPLKLIALANATEINSPLTNILDVTDILSEMVTNGEHETYLANRGIVLSLLQTPETFMESERSGIIYRALADTDWGEMAYNNEFSYNDRSNVKRINLKGFRPWFSIEVKAGKTWYIYQHDNGTVYCCRSRFNNRDIPQMDLKKENDQKRYYRDYYFTLREAVIEDRARFEQYTMYDLLVNFKQFYNV